MASIPAAKYPLPRTIRAVEPSFPFRPINSGKLPLVLPLIPSQAADLIRSAAVTPRVAAAYTVLIIRKRTYVRSRVPTRDIRAKHEGVLPVRPIPTTRSAEIKATLPSRAYVRAVPLVIRVVALALRAVIAASALVLGVSTKASLDVTKGPTYVIRTMATQACLKVPAIPSEAMTFILQVLLAA